MVKSLESNKRIAKNTAVLYVRMIFVLLVSLYSTRAILNALGVVDYGIYNVVAGFVSMFAFLNSSMTNTVQRFFNYEKGRSDNGNINRVYVTSIQIQVVLAVFTFLLLEIVGMWYIKTKMVIPLERLTAAIYVFQFSIISLIILILQIPFAAAVIAHERMGFYAVVSMTDAILKLIIAIFLPFVPYDKLIYYGAAMLIISIVDIVLYYLYSKKNFVEIVYHHCYNKALFKKMLSFSAWNLFDSFAYTMQGQGLNMLINAFYGPVVNASRGIAYQIQSALSGFTENIAVAFKPQLVESYAKEEFGRTKKLMYSMSKLGYLMVYVLALPISLEIGYILNIWLDGTVPEDTDIFTILVLFNMAIGSLNLPISQTVQATGNIKNYQIVRSVIVTSVLPLSWWALICGAPAYIIFIILIVINAVNQPVSMYLLRRVFDYSYGEYFHRVILPCLLFSIVAPVVPFIIHSVLCESLARLFAVGVSSVLVSVILIYFIVMTDDEKFLVKEMTKRIINKSNYHQ